MKKVRVVVVVVVVVTAQRMASDAVPVFRLREVGGEVCWLQCGV